MDILVILYVIQITRISQNTKASIQIFNTLQFTYLMVHKTGVAFFISGSCYFLENCLVLQWHIPFYIKKSHACNL